MIQIDMDMPKNCSSCRFSFGMCCGVKKVDHENYYKAIPKLSFIEARPYWCPLSEVKNE